MCGELSTYDPIGIAVAQSPEAGSVSVPSAIQIPSSQGGSRREKSRGGIHVRLERLHNLNSRPLSGKKKKQHTP